MHNLIEPCGLHCIKINQIGVTIGEQTILSDVSMHIHCGQLAAVIGRNGAGKSTLIKAILGAVPHTGTIEFKDREDGHIQHMRIGYVPQSLNVEKKTPLSVYDMFVCYQSRFPAFLARNKKLYRRIRETLAVFHAEDLIDKQVCNLSGGELQRVMLSMAVMDEPNLLLLDEPVSGIDQNGMDLFFRTIEDLKTHYDLAVILISHDLDYVAAYADQVILLEHRVLAQGSVRQVYGSEAFHRVFGAYDLDRIPRERLREEARTSAIGNRKHTTMGIWKEGE